jgi:TPP-dependent pyruvate/acetoin dehydrogenase alpha subunit
MRRQQRRSGDGPTIVIAETFRMGGHATHDEKEARDLFPPAVFDYWGKRDPIGMYESYLQTRGFSKADLEGVEGRVLDEIAGAERDALASRESRMPRPETALAGVYFSSGSVEVSERKSPERRPTKAGSTHKTPSS